MLVNLAIALRNVGREEHAAQVSRRALSLPRDDGSPVHEVLLALDAALAGEPRTAASGLGESHRALDSYYKFLAAVVDALAVSAADEDRRAGYAGAVARLRAARSEIGDFERFRYLRGVLRHAIRLLAARRSRGAALQRFYRLLAAYRVGR
jgi:hypothetical protein